MRLLSLLFTVVVSVVAFAQVPTITSFSPTSGNVGSSVVLSGSNFDATASNNIVYFGSVKAVVTSATTTSLTVTVPAGSTYAPITVVANGKQGCSRTPFMVSNSTIAGLPYSASSFSTTTIYNTGVHGYPSDWVGDDMAVGDFDLDGKTDVVKYSNGQSVDVNRNTSTPGTVSFAAATIFSVSAYVPNSDNAMDISVGDVNNDGKLDIVVIKSHIIVLINNSSAAGTISFLSPVVFSISSEHQRVDLSDVNNDGFLDFLYSNASYNSNATQIKVKLNSGTSAIFSAATPTTLTVVGHKHFSLADLNNDNIEDLIVSNSSASTSYVYLNTTSGGNVSFGTAISLTSTGNRNNYPCDINLDGTSDLFSNYTTATTSPAITTNQYTSGTFSASSVNTTSSNITVSSTGDAYLALGNIDGDTKLDAISLVYPSGFNGYALTEAKLMAGYDAGSFATNINVLSLIPGNNTATTLIFDVDGDNKQDFVNARGYYTSFHVIKNNIAPSAPTISGQPTLSTTSICAGTSSGSLSITAAGATSYQWQISSNAGSTWTDIAGMTGSTFPGMTMNTAGSFIFRCKAINSTGTTNSSATGTLTVNAAPTLTTDLTATAITLCYANTPTNLTVAASGSPTYQWQVSSTGVNGSYANVTATNGANGTTATFTPSHANIWYGGTKYYQCIVTVNGCSTTSTAKQYNIHADLTWTNPSNAAQNICINGSSTALSMTASGPNVVYSWQKSPNGSSSWTSISGANTNTYTPPTNVSGVNYYRCYISGTCSNTATASSGAITVTDTYTWTGATSTDPTVAGNWNPAAVPCSGANEVIPSGLTNYPVYTNLTIDAGTTLTVNTGGRLTVTGTLTNNGTMTIESGATFVQGTSLAGSGTYNVKQFVTGAGGSTPSGRFWYMGLPINNLSRQTAFGAASASNRLWSWSESAQAWSSQITDATALSPTTGYVFRTGADVTLTFTGTSLYSADASITGLTNTTGSFDGCHLMSNPYTAYLDWDQIAAAAGTTNLSSTVTVRSYNTSNSQMVYDTYNATGSVAVQNSSYAVSKYIAPMQSFWVVVNPSTTGTLSMTKAMLTHQPTAPGLKDLTSFPAFARLNLVDGSFTDQVVVYTDAEANAELEAFDSKKFFLPNVAQVYCKVGNDKLVINALKKGKAQTSAPLTVELPSTKVYKFEMAESFVDNGLVILEDRQEGIFQDMGINPTYEFFGNSGVIADRFVLHFQLPNGASNEGQAGVEDLTSSQIAVISNQNGSILVSLSADLTATGEVQVLDAAGRLIQTTAIKGQDTKLQITEGTGVYFVRVSTPMKSETKKVLVY